MEDENRQEGKTIQQRGKEAAGTIKKAEKKLSTFRKILAVPILGKLVLFGMIAIVILFFVGGTIMFFFNMPNMARDRFASILNFDLNWQSYKDIGAEIKPETLKAMAMDLIYKGYDLEGYGFVNNEEYENYDISVKKDSLVFENKDTKQIESIQSKCIKAYLVADNATYKIAEQNYNPNLMTRYSRDLILQILTEGNPDAKIDEKKYQKFFEVLELNINLELNHYAMMKKEDLVTAIIRTIRDMAWTNEVGKELQNMHLTREQLLARMEDASEYEFSSGLIALDDKLPKGVDIAIDRESKQLVVAVEEIEDYKDAKPRRSGNIIV